MKAVIGLGVPCVALISAGLPSNGAGVPKAEVILLADANVMWVEKDATPNAEIAIEH